MGYKRPREIAKEGGRGGMEDRMFGQNVIVSVHESLSVCVLVSQ